MPHKSQKNRGRKRRKRAFFRRSAFDAGKRIRSYYGGSAAQAPAFDVASFIRMFSRKGRS